MNEKDHIADNIQNLTRSSEDRLNEWAHENGVNPDWDQFPLIQDVWNSQQEIIDTYQKIISALAPELNPSLFICGHSSINPSDGLPKYLYVCPEFGSDVVVAYKKKR